MILDVIIGILLVFSAFGFFLVWYSGRYTQKQLNMNDRMMLKEAQLASRNRFISTLGGSIQNHAQEVASTLIGNHAENINNSINQGEYGVPFAERTVYQARNGTLFQHESIVAGMKIFHECDNPNCQWNCPNGAAVMARVNNVLQIDKEEEARRLLQKRLREQRKQEAEAAKRAKAELQQQQKMAKAIQSHQSHSQSHTEQENEWEQLAASPQPQATTDRKSKILKLHSNRVA